MADSKWYKNPTIFDETNDWFLCFDDDDPPELVIYQPKQLTKEKRMIRIFEVIDTAKIKARVLVRTVCQANRLFPPNWSIDFKPSMSVFLEIYNRIDIKKLSIKHEGVSEELPTDLCGYVAYDFKPI